MASGSKERGHDRYDRLAVVRRMVRDSPQRVESTDPHVRLLAAELVDCPAEAVSDVPFSGGVQSLLANPQLPPGGVRPEEEDSATGRLQKCRAHTVDGSEPFSGRDPGTRQIAVDHQPRQHHDDYGQRGQHGQHRPRGEECVTDPTMSQGARYPAAMSRSPRIHAHMIAGRSGNRAVAMRSATGRRRCPVVDGRACSMNPTDLSS